MEPIILNPNSDASTCMQLSANNPPNTVSQLKKLFLKTNISIGNTNANNMQQLQINSESITLKPRPTYTNRNISELQNMRPMSPSSVKAQQTKQMQPMANFDSYSSDEFESAFKIKENIQLSLKNLKPTLAGLDVLRSSASDDDDWPSQPPQSDQSNRPDNYTPDAKKSQTPVYNSNNNNSTNCMKTNFKPSMSLVNANGTTPTSTLKLQVTNSLAKPNYVRAPNRSTYYLPTSTTTTQAILTPIYNSATASLKKQAQSKISNKRGKEEALSNSSSSDEDDHYQQSQKTALVNHQNKLQQLLLNNNNNNNNGTLPSTSQLSTLKLPITTNSMNFNNNLRQQSYNITPVMSSFQAQASLQQQQQQQQQQTNPTITVTSSSSNISKPITNESDGLNGHLANTLKSCKTDHEYDNKQNSSLNSQSSPALLSSSASSIASFSPINSVTSPCTANETFDILDDSSSTASGPIYVRQPGFEHHAHEVTLDQSKSQSNNNSHNNGRSVETKITKIASESNKIKNMLAAAAAAATTTTTTTNHIDHLNTNAKANSKAKKKLCTITNTTCTLPPTTLPNHVAPTTTTTTTTSTMNVENNQNKQLKPLTKFPRKDFLPMRLRPLPTSFWQQPNQVNISPGSMCLPPLFKTDSDDEESSMDDYKTSFETTTKNAKDVKMSPANTDLLFKLFDSVEQNDKRHTLKLTNQWNPRPPASKPLKGFSKAFIKSEDPYILDAVAEGLFPLLRLDTRNDTPQYYPLKNNDTMLNCFNLACNNSSNSNQGSNNLQQNTLPLLQIDQNYTQVLSEVVAAL